MERYKIKIIKKYNISPEKIALRFRSRPNYEVSGVVIGKNISYETARDYLVKYLNESHAIKSVLSIRLQQ